MLLHVEYTTVLQVASAGVLIIEDMRELIEEGRWVFHVEGIPVLHEEDREF